MAGAAAMGSEQGSSEINGVSGWKLHSFGVAALGWEEWGLAPHGRRGGGELGSRVPPGKVGDAGGEDGELRVQGLDRGWGC